MCDSGNSNGVDDFEMDGNQDIDELLEIIDEPDWLDDDTAFGEKTKFCTVCGTTTSVTSGDVSYCGSCGRELVAVDDGEFDGMFSIDSDNSPSIGPDVRIDSDDEFDPTLDEPIQYKSEEM